MFAKNWMHPDGQLLSVAIVAALTLSIAGCPPAAMPTDDPASQQPQPLDNDGDGVIDDEDDCPGTPAGVEIDEDGCEVPAVIIVDDDGDGVANDNDDCAGTPGDETANASGCSASQRDTDGDGVMDDADKCPSTPTTVTIDDDGCPVGDPDEADSDGDGVGDDIDQCLETPARETVDANGCASSQLDTDNDGVTDDIDTCPETPAGETANDEGCSPSQIDDGTGPSGGDPPDGAVCGNGIQEAGEGCDDGNTDNGDGCNSTCQVETAGPPNNSCADALIAVDGIQDFSNIGATTDGPDEPAMCDFGFGTTQVEADVWYCYQATCTGEVVVSLCGSGFDTKMAVYNGCGCPSGAGTATACSDDGCGTAFANVESSVSFQAVEGQQYMIRIGGFEEAQGEGRLRITCGAPSACETKPNDCFTESSDASTGCSDVTCCETVCAVDRYCCDVAWDSFCASEAAGLCTEVCQVGIGSCQIARDTPGCGTVDCCNTVCEADPFCCFDKWDETCVDEANSLCFLTCGGRSGDCFTKHDDAGCNTISCCELVCARSEDPFCCETAWDEECATAAQRLCQ